MALMTLLQQGDHVAAAGALYGGTVTMLAVNLKKFGVETTFVDATRPEAFAAGDPPFNTRAIFAESLATPARRARHRPRWPRWRMRTASRW